MKQLSEVEQLRLQVELLKKVSELGKKIDKVSLIKLVEEYKKTCPVSIILECFESNAPPFIAGNRSVRIPQKRDEIADKIEQLCMANRFIYGYRTITRLLKKVYNLVVNRKKVYRIMKEKGCFCRVRPKKGPKLGSLTM